MPFKIGDKVRLKGSEQNMVVSKVTQAANASHHPMVTCRWMVKGKPMSDAFEEPTLELVPPAKKNVVLGLGSGGRRGVAIVKTRTRR